MHPYEKSNNERSIFGNPFGPLVFYLFGPLESVYGRSSFLLGTTITVICH